MKRVLIIHGPNLSLLGQREPEIYGTLSLQEINDRILRHATQRSLELRFLQSNHEGALIDFLHENRAWADGVVINPGALTHYSYALRDAIAALSLPTVEVHLSDIKKREAFRKVSVIEDVCMAQISGQGYRGYLQALDCLIERG